ncbi:hypothetical protein AAG570_003253, partial [Ranatra chinensis]
RAGYVPVDESCLQKTGLRGRKTYAFWSLVGIVCLLAWANMALTLVVFRVLRLGGRGLDSIELVSREGAVKFFGLADLGRIFKPDGRLEGFLEEPVSVSGDGGPLIFRVQDSRGRVQSALTVANNGSTVSGVDTFKIVSDNKLIFSTQNPEYRVPAEGLHRLDAAVIKTGRLTGNTAERLVLRSDSFAKLRGSEGTRLEGLDINWSADQDITLTSANGSLILDGRGGIAIDVEKIPIVGRRRLAGYKVCVCMPQGRLFRVQVPTHYTSQIACHNIDQSYRNSPCI